MNLTMIMSAGEFPKDIEVCEAIAGNLTEAGVNVKVEELESGEFNKRGGEAGWDIQPNGTTGWTGDAEFFLTLIKQTSGFGTPEIDKMMADGNNMLDHSQRIANLQQTMKKAWSEVPLLWGFEIIWVHGISKKVKGTRLIPPGWLFFEQAEVS